MTPSRSTFTRASSLPLAFAVCCAPVLPSCSLPLLGGDDGEAAKEDCRNQGFLQPDWLAPATRHAGRYAFVWLDGWPIHQRKERLRQLAGGPGLRMAELGCGGTPAVFLAERCATCPYYSY